MRKPRAPRPVYMRFIFVKFDPTYEDSKLLDKIPFMNFLVRGLEVAPSTLRLHWQGYLEVTVPLRPRALMRLLPGFHVEPATANRVSNLRYCSKGGKVYIFDLYPLYHQKEGGDKGGDGSIHPSLSLIDQDARQAWEEYKNNL